MLPCVNGNTGEEVRGAGVLMGKAIGRNPGNASVKQRRAALLEGREAYLRGEPCVLLVDERQLPSLGHYLGPQARDLFSCSE